MQTKEFYYSTDLNEMFPSINDEKNKVLQHDGNSRVVANPGTGKTLLLAYKYCQLVQSGIPPDQILCLTFTRKARAEMEDRIRNVLKNEMVKLHIPNVYTFHSFAHDTLNETNIVSSNIMRYVIFKFLKKHEVFSYGDNYLLGTIVPRIENLLRYLKNFNIIADTLNSDMLKANLPESKFEREDLEQFAGWFVEIFKEYERVKFKKGKDYADLLIEFLKLKNPPRFKWVLVDELQDVNKLEAEIVRRCAENFFVVGDKKQAIFGFQGGSMYNFSMFEPAKEFVLKENFRSTNEILRYASEYFKKSKDERMRSEVEGLANPGAEKGEKPKVFRIEKGDEDLIASFITTLQGRVCVVARTNAQVQKLSRRLREMGVPHETTYDSASSYVKGQIIAFIKGLLSNEPKDLQQALLTPFFPAPIQEVFEFLERGGDPLKAFPRFRELRGRAKCLADLVEVLEDVVLPVAVAHGKEWVLATQNIAGALEDAQEVAERIGELEAFLQSSDLLADELAADSKLTLTTVHKAKGKQWDTVIYWPSKPHNQTSHADIVAEAALLSQGIDTREELEEECLRIDFVAMTRAKKRLYIFTEKPDGYLNEFAEFEKLSLERRAGSTQERLKEAFALFVNGELEAAKRLLEREEKWFLPYLKSYFSRLNHISFSQLLPPEDYLLKKVLCISSRNPAIDLGTRVHEFVNKRLKDEPAGEIPDEIAGNIENLLSRIQRKFPRMVGSELVFTLPVNEIFDVEEELPFTGKIDAVFTNGDEHLIVDWKTSAREKGSDYRQQLAVYRRAYSVQYGVPEEKIKVAIGYVALRKRINDGHFYANLDERQPAPSAIRTVEGKVRTLLEWKEDPGRFIGALKKTCKDNLVVKRLIEVTAVDDLV